MRGFVVSDFQDQYFADFFKGVRELLLSKQIVYRVDEARGIDKAPQAFVGMLRGENFGKAVVHVADL